MAICPECVAGKHVNCVGEAFDEVTDEIVPCACDTKAYVQLKTGIGNLNLLKE